MFSSYYLTRSACDLRRKELNSRKLKVLCFHGYNSDKNVMEYQMRHFRLVFGEVIDFEIIDAPFVCQEPPVEEMKRFLPNHDAHFRSWLKFYGWGTEEEKKTKVPNCVYGLEEATQYIIDILKGPKGPFDGVLGFSQGGIIFRHFYNITQKIDRESFLVPGSQRQVFEMPRFFMTVASPVFTNMKILYKNQIYEQQAVPQFNFPSIHLHGTKDTYFKYLKIHELFAPEANPVVIEFDEGHKFPRSISDEGFNQLKEFVRARYNEKNSSEREQVPFEVNYDKFNFSVRYPGLEGAK